MTKIRVLQLITTLELAGAQSLLLDLCRGLDPSRFEITVAYLRGHAEMLGTGEARESDQRSDGIQFVDLSDGGRFSPWALGRVISLVRKHDLIHTHLVHASIVGIAAARIARSTKIIYSRHHAGVDRPRPDYWLEEQLAKSAAAAIAVSESTRLEMIRAGLREERIQTIWNAIDVDRIESQAVASGNRTTAPVIGVVARLAPQKSLEVLIEAFSIVLQEFPDSALEIVGEGPELSRLQESARTFKCEERVDFCGTLHRSAIPKRLAQWDVFALTSQREPFGIVAAEAMAAGTPVVVSDVDGLREVVSDGRTGLTFPVGSAAAAAKCILRILQDKELRDRLTDAAFVEVKERFDLKTCLAKHAALYESLYTRTGLYSESD